MSKLGGDAILAYEEALACIRESDFSGIPISPIDYIEQQLERAGYRGNRSHRAQVGH